MKFALAITLLAATIAASPMPNSDGRARVGCIGCTGSCSKRSTSLKRCSCPGGKSQTIQASLPFLQWSWIVLTVVV